MKFNMTFTHNLKVYCGLLVFSVSLILRTVISVSLVFPGEGHLTKRVTRQSFEPKPISFRIGQNQPPQERKFRLTSDPKCNTMGGNLGYCVEDPEYDSVIQQKFDEILQRNSPMNNNIFDVLNETIIPVTSPEDWLHTRDGFVFENTPCPARETIIYPMRGKTVNSDWVFILQKNDIQQGVKVDKCLQDGSECKIGGGSLPQTACRQKYVYKKLLTMDTTGNDIVTESIFLPSCCVCYISSQFISSKIGGQCDPGQ